MRAFTLFVAAFCLLLTGVSFAAQPSEPGDLRAAVYSNTAAELFWSRSTDSDGFVRGYEIRRNGELVTTIDALSYFTDDLTPGEVFAFTVTAVNFDNEQSTAASVTVSTSSNTSLAEATGNESIPVEEGQPAAPTNLRVAVYSDTIAEIFWDRVTEQQLTYEISINTVVVRITSGTSHVFTGLPPGITSSVDVVAVNAAGLRSSPTLLSVTTTNGNGIVLLPEEPVQIPSEEPTNDENTLPEIRPQDLTIEVYSASSAELFWTPNGSIRPPVFANEIRRDGVLIDTVEGGFLRSYFDSNRDSGTRYVYEVTAISSLGQASATITGPGFNLSAPVDPIDADIPDATTQRLETMLSIVNGEAIEKAVATFYRLADRNLRSDLGFEFIESVAPAQASPFFLYSCPDGGELRDFQIESSTVSPDDPFSFSLAVTNCKVGPITASGSYGGGVTNFEPGVLLELDTRSFTSDMALIEDERDGSTIEYDRLRYFPEELDSLISSYELTRPAISRNGVTWTFDTQLNVRGADTFNSLPDGSLGSTVSESSLNPDEPSLTGLYDEAVDIRTLGPLEFANGRELGQPSAGRLSIALH